MISLAHHLESLQAGPPSTAMRWNIQAHSVRQALLLPHLVTTADEPCCYPLFHTLLQPEAITAVGVFPIAPLNANERVLA